MAYEELGGVHEQKVFYPEGAVYTHPSGAVYKRVNGDWKLIKKSNGDLVPSNVDPMP